MHAKRMDKIATGVLYAISGIIVAILASLILYILVRGLPHVSWHFLTGKSSSYQAGGGIGIQLYNSFFLLVITFPLSLGAGIYLSEYAKKGRLTNLVRTCIEILSSLPSVVVGLFGYLVFVVQFKYGFSIISGALALTVFNLPQMTRNIEDSLQHVHHTQREASTGLVSLGNCDSCRGTRSSSKYYHWGCLGLWTDLWGSRCLDLYSRSIGSSP